MLLTWPIKQALDIRAESREQKKINRNPHVYDIYMQISIDSEDTGDKRLAHFMALPPIVFPAQAPPLLVYVPLTAIKYSACSTCV